MKRVQTIFTLESGWIMEWARRRFYRVEGEFRRRREGNCAMIASILISALIPMGLQ